MWRKVSSVTVAQKEDQISVIMSYKTCADIAGKIRGTSPKLPEKNIAVYSR